MSGRSAALEGMRSRVFDKMDIIRSDRVLVLNAGHGLLVWEAFRHTPEGLVVAQVRSKEDLAYLNQYISTLDSVSAPQVVLQSDCIKALKGLEKGLLFEHIIGRNLLTDWPNSKATLDAIKSRMAPNGDAVLCETVVSEASRLSEFFHMGPLQDILLKAEKKIYAKVQSRDDLLSRLNEAFGNVEIQDYRFTESRTAREDDIRRWFANSYLPALKDITETEAQKIEKEMISTLCAAPLRWNTSCIIAHLR
jgi:putative ATPase